MSAESELRLTKSSDLSIEDLQARQREGVSVLRTAHIGNLSPYNLALADSGVPILLVDQNVHGFDNTYYPGMRIQDGVAVSLTDAPAVSFRSSVQGLEGAQYLDEYHLQGLRQAFPDATFFTNTQYLRENETVVGEVMSIARREMPEVFKRVVRSDGTTAKDGYLARQYAQSGNIAQLRDDFRCGEAALAPNEVDIIANFVVESLKTGLNRQIHISGPAMVNYAFQRQTRQQLDHLYAAVARESSFGSQLPPELEVDIVDATSARFAQPIDEAPELQSLMDEYSAMQAQLTIINDRRREFFQSAQAKDITQREAFLESIRSCEAAAKLAVRAALEPVEPVLEDAHADDVEVFTTQYDVIAAGGLYVATQNRSLSFAELSTATKELRKMGEKAMI